MSDSSTAPKKPIHKKWWFWAIIVFVLYLIGSSASKAPNSGSPSASQPSAPPKAAAPSEEVISISATDLFAAYEKNEIAADAAYKGRLLKVDGVVENIGKDITDTPYVALKAGPLFGVQCMLAKSAVDQASELEAGKTVTLQGRNSGKLGEVILRDCVFVGQ